MVDLHRRSYIQDLIAAIERDAEERIAAIRRDAEAAVTQLLERDVQIPLNDPELPERGTWVSMKKAGELAKVSAQTVKNWADDDLIESRPGKGAGSPTLVDAHEVYLRARLLKETRRRGRPIGGGKTGQN